MWASSTTVVEWFLKADSPIDAATTEITIYLPRNGNPCDEPSRSVKEVGVAYGPERITIRVLADPAPRPIFWCAMAYLGPGPHGEAFSVALAEPVGDRLIVPAASPIGFLAEPAFLLTGAGLILVGSVGLQLWSARRPRRERWVFSRPLLTYGLWGVGTMAWFFFMADVGSSSDPRTSVAPILLGALWMLPPIFANRVDGILNALERSLVFYLAGTPLFGLWTVSNFLAVGVRPPLERDFTLLAFTIAASCVAAIVLGSERARAVTSDEADPHELAGAAPQTRTQN